MKKLMIGMLVVLPLALTACGTTVQGTALQGSQAPNGNKTQDNTQGAQGSQAGTQSSTATSGSDSSGTQTNAKPATTSNTSTASTISNPPPAPSGQVIGNPPYIETASADAVVTEYFYAIGRQDYETAWMMIHPGGKTRVTKEEFQSKQKPLTAKNVSNQLKETLDEYKIYTNQIRYTNVAVVEASFSDGTKKTLHLVKGDQGKGWKLFWDPATNDLD